jgi:HipA-like protein
MISTWDANKGLSFDSASQFQPTDKWKLLRRIAWAMMNERDESLGLALPNAQGNVIEQSHLEAIVEDFCRLHYGLSGDEALSIARALLQHLRERNYVLALLGGTAFGFVHRTFLEYLAAREAIERFRHRTMSETQLEEMVCARWQMTEWNEVLKLIFAILQEERPELVVRLLQAPTVGLMLIHPDESGDAGFYVGFAFGGIAELDQPEQEPARLFAVMLAELMVALMRISPLWSWLPLVTGERSLPGAEVFARVISDRSADDRVRRWAARMGSVWGTGDFASKNKRERLVSMDTGSADPATSAKWMTLAGSLPLGESEGKMLSAISDRLPRDSASAFLKFSAYGFRFQGRDKTLPRSIHHRLARRSDGRQKGDPVAGLALWFHFPPSVPVPPALFTVAEKLLAARRESARGLAAEWLLRLRPAHPEATRVLEAIADHSRVLAYRFRAIRLLESRDRLRKFRDTWFSGPRPKGLGKTFRPSSKGLWLLVDEQKVTAEKVNGLLRLVDRVEALQAVGRPRRAIVRRDGVRVGVLEETGTGTSFAYDGEYVRQPGARAISPVLPLRDEPFVQARGVLPFFANLLPEGSLLDAYCQQFGLERTDVFGLLLVAAGDVAGAVEIVPMHGAETS